MVIRAVASCLCNRSTRSSPSLEACCSRTATTNERPSSKRSRHRVTRDVASAGDPWSSGTPAASVRGRTAGHVVAAIALGASGPVIRRLADRPAGPAWLVVLCGITAALVVLVRRGPLTVSVRARPARGRGGGDRVDPVRAVDGDGRPPRGCAGPHRGGPLGPDATERVVGPVLRALVRAGTAFASGILLVVAMPLMYLPGFLAERIAPQRWAGWQPPSPLGATRRGAVAPFAPELVVSRRRRVVVCLASVVVAAVAATVLVVGSRNLDRPSERDHVAATASTASSDGVDAQHDVALQERPVGVGLPGEALTVKDFLEPLDPAAVEVLDEWRHLPYHRTPDGPNLYDMGDFKTAVHQRRGRRPTDARPRRATVSHSISGSSEAPPRSVSGRGMTARSPRTS